MPSDRRRAAGGRPGRGYFSRGGLAIELVGRALLASIRDKLATGVLDGAQMLAPMPLAASL